MMKKLTTLLVAFLSASVLFAVESATLNIKIKKGGIESSQYPVQRINENTVRVTIPKSAIPSNYEWFEVLADNAVAMKGEKGFWIISRGEMGTFRCDNGKYTRIPQLPLFGMQNPRETFIGIVRGMQYDMAMVIDVEDGVYKIRPRWNEKHLGYLPYEDIVIDFVTLTGDDANYSGMGRTYRKIRLSEGKFKPFKERMKTRKALREIATAMPHRIEPHGFLALGVRGKKGTFNFKPSEVEGKFRASLTFYDAKKFVDAFKAAGMTDVHFCDAGWQCGGYDGRCPQILPIEKALGGEKALKEFTDYTRAQGYQVCSNSNHTDAYTCSTMWDEDYVCKRADGSLFRAANLTGGTMYYICIQRSWELFIKDQLDKTKELGYEGILYIDVFSARQPDQCFDPRHKVNRKQQAEAQCRTLAYARKLFGGAASECGYEHCLHELDYINYLGRHMLYGEGYGDRQFSKNAYYGDKTKYNPLIDRIAPLWEIVYHGIVLSNPDKFTQGYRPKGSTNFLRLVEFGGRPIRYNSSYKPEHIAEYKAMYDAFQPLKHLQLEFMEENRPLAKDVYLTRYSDGSEVITNYSMSDFTYKSVVAKARDYVLIDGRKK